MRAKLDFLGTVAAEIIKEFMLSLQQRQRNWKTKRDGKSDGKAIAYMKKHSHVSFYSPTNMEKLSFTVCQY